MTRPTESRPRRPCAGRSSWTSTSSTRPTPTARRSARRSSPRPSTRTPTTWSSRPRAAWCGPARAAGSRDGRPEHLREACEGSLRRLRLEQIPLYQFHPPDPKVPLADSIGTLVELKAEGKIRHVGVSNFSDEQVAGGPADRPRGVGAEPLQRPRPLLRAGRGPVHAGGAGLPAVGADPGADRIAAVQRGERLGVSERQVALAWLLAHSPQILPIPGSGSPEHVEDNIAAAGLELTAEEYNSITDSIEVG